MTNRHHVDDHPEQRPRDCTQSAARQRERSKQLLEILPSECIVSFVLIQLFLAVDPSKLRRALHGKWSRDDVPAESSVSRELLAPCRSHSQYSGLPEQFERQIDERRLETVIRH